MPVIRRRRGDVELRILILCLGVRTRRAGDGRIGVDGKSSDVFCMLLCIVATVAMARATPRPLPVVSFSHVPQRSSTKQRYQKLIDCDARKQEIEMLGTSPRRARLTIGKGRDGTNRNPLPRLIYRYLYAYECATSRPSHPSFECGGVSQRWCECKVDQSTRARCWLAAHDSHTAKPSPGPGDVAAARCRCWASRASRSHACRLFRHIIHIIHGEFFLELLLLTQPKGGTYVGDVRGELRVGCG